MLRSVEKKRLKWAKDNVPLFAMRSEDDMHRIIRTATYESRGVAIGLSVSVSLLIALAFSGLRTAYIEGTLEKNELYIIAAAIGGVSGWFSWFLAEQVFRHKVEKLANMP